MNETLRKMAELIEQHALTPFSAQIGPGCESGQLHLRFTDFERLMSGRRVKLDYATGDYEGTFNGVKIVSWATTHTPPKVSEVVMPELEDVCRT